MPPTTQEASAPVRLMRTAVNGGPPQLVVEAPNIRNYQCSRAPAGPCVFSQQEPNQSVFAVFDPVHGNPREVAKLEERAVGAETGGGVHFPIFWNWSLSPDGTSIAAVGFGARDNRIRLLSLSGRPQREIVVKNWNSFTSVDWAADAKGLFLSSNPTGRRSALLYVDLLGNAHALLEVKSFTPSWAIPSRNGKYLAIPAPTIESNVWMVENF